MRFVWLPLMVCSVMMAQEPNPEQMFRDAIAAQQRGDDQTAIAKYQELIRLRPDVVEVRPN